MDNRSSNFQIGRTDEPMVYQTQTAESHHAHVVAEVSRQGRDELKAKMQKAQFSMGMNTDATKETSYTNAVKAVADGANAFGDVEGNNLMIKENKKTSIVIGSKGIVNFKSTEA